MLAPTLHILLHVITQTIHQQLIKSNDGKEAQESLTATS